LMLNEEKKDYELIEKIINRLTVLNPVKALDFM
jgi:hypothetical protein